MRWAAPSPFYCPEYFRLACQKNLASVPWRRVAPRCLRRRISSAKIVAHRREHLERRETGKNVVLPLPRAIMRRREPQGNAAISAVSKDLRSIDHAIDVTCSAREVFFRAYRRRLWGLKDCCRAPENETGRLARRALASDPFGTRRHASIIIVGHDSKRRIFLEVHNAPPRVPSRAKLWFLLFHLSFSCSISMD